MCKGMGLISHSWHGHGSSIHAAIYIGFDKIAEATGHGIKQAILSPAGRLGRWIAYSQCQTSIAKNASDTAGRWSADEHGGAYDLGKAIASLFHRSTHGKSSIKRAARWNRHGATDSKKEPMFCSEFVIACYQASGGLEVLERDALHTSPKELENFLESNSKKGWTSLGTVKFR